MKHTRRFTSGCTFLAIAGVLACWISAFPAVAQQGQDAVYNSFGQVTNSPSFIDASMFAASAPNMHQSGSSSILMAISLARATPRRSRLNGRPVARISSFFVIASHPQSLTLRVISTALVGRVRTTPEQWRNFRPAPMVGRRPCCTAFAPGLPIVATVSRRSGV